MTSMSLFSSLWAQPGWAGAIGIAVISVAAGYAVLAVIDRNPPVTGDNNIMITIKDAAGKIVADAKTKDFRFSSIILGIANSTPFQMRRTQ